MKHGIRTLENDMVCLEQTGPDACVMKRVRVLMYLRHGSLSANQGRVGKAGLDNNSLLQPKHAPGATTFSAALPKLYGVLWSQSCLPATRPL